MLLSDFRRRLVDATVMQNVRLSRNLILLLRIGYDFFVFEHELVVIKQLVMGCRAPE